MMRRNENQSLSQLNLVWLSRSTCLSNENYRYLDDQAVVCAALIIWSVCQRDPHTASLSTPALNIIAS